MDASTNGHDRTQYEEDVLPTGWRWSLPRALGLMAFLAMALFWIWAFANRDSIAHPDTFDDPVYVQAAEALCSERQATIASFPQATAARDAIERGELIVLGTEQLELMVAELGELQPPTDPVGAAGVERWLSDYQLYLQDRRNYSDILATGDDPPFVISGTEDGIRVTDLLANFAEVNTMSSCAPSGDV